MVAKLFPKHSSRDRPDLISLSWEALPAHVPDSALELNPAILSLASPHPPEALGTDTLSLQLTRTLPAAHLTKCISCQLYPSSLRHLFPPSGEAVGIFFFFSQGEGNASLFYLLSEYLLCGTACPSGPPSVTTKGFLCQHLLFLEPGGFKDPQAMFHLLVPWNISEFYQSV